MSCCGDKRRALSTAPPSPPVTFEYRGRTSLTVVGAATRRIYWFAGPGARVAVHPRDVESMKEAPELEVARSQ
jgi:hypothetical protein